MIDLQLLYNEYLNQKFSRGLPSTPLDRFEYSPCEGGGAELFFAGETEEAFSVWISELQPRDPNYTASPDWEPVLLSSFPQMDVYDELICYYLLFTLNSTTSVAKINPYNAMNDFMKNYGFLQLTHLADAVTLDDEQKCQLRDFFWFFYLYAHPVNGETLYAFTFSGQNLIHTKTGINVERYLCVYHDYYRDNVEKVSGSVNLSPEDIDACKDLTLQLLGHIEGKMGRLILPPEAGVEPVLELINNVDGMIHAYAKDKAAVFKVMRDCFPGQRSTPYHLHCFSTLLQNYVCYILFFNFDEVNHLVDYFKGDPAVCGIILNKMFADTIFIQRMMRLHHIDIRSYPKVTEYFDERAKGIYL